MTLEQLIDEAAKRGGLTALTLYPTKGGWQGNAKRRAGGAEGWCCEARESPSAALVAALQGAVDTRVVQERPRVPAASDDAGEDIFG